MPPECSQVTCLKLFLVDRNLPSTEAVTTQNRLQVFGDYRLHGFLGALQTRHIFVATDMLLHAVEIIKALKAKFHYATWFGASSKPVRSRFGAGSDLVSFGFGSELAPNRFGAGSELVRSWFEAGSIQIP